MANEQNLIRNEDLTPSQRRANASKAGKASAAKRKERKAMQELAREVLSMPLKDEPVEEVSAFAEANGKNVTVEQAALLQQAKKALKGDTSALVFLRDTAGEKPVERVDVGGDVAAAAEDIRRMVAAAKAEGDGR